jgi:hypothetical protein
VRGGKVGSNSIRKKELCKQIENVIGGERYRNPSSKLSQINLHLHCIPNKFGVKKTVEK